MHVADLCQRRREEMSALIGEPTVSVEFEVYGHVQGLSFTKFCKDYSEQLGLKGWVKNSKKGTIVGKIQGSRTNVDTMIQWLAHTGSPGCEIERCELMNFQNLRSPDYTDFSIRF